MTDRARYRPVEDEIRAKLSQMIEIATPYARSSGGFVNWRDLRYAIRLALHEGERAQLLADYRLPPEE